MEALNLGVSTQTLNLTKSYDFFKPEDVKEHIHIIGCGSVGSTVAELLVRFGLTKLTLYDFDRVEPKNLANQLFRQEHVGKLKVNALADMLYEINPEVRGNDASSGIYPLNQKTVHQSIIETIKIGQNLSQPTL